MWPILFRVGDFEVGTYGVLLVLSVLGALWLAGRLAKRDGLDSGRVIDVGVATTFSGILGSKLLGVLVALLSGVALNWAEVRNAGAVHGGLLGGLLAVYLLTRYFKLPLGLTLDAYVPAVALGQGLGRLSCFAAGCCFGHESHLPWAVTYTDPAAVVLGGVPLGVPTHPVQLYDTLLHCALACVLVWMHRRRLFHGRLIAPWCIFEGILRFSLESFRGDLGRGVWWNVSWLSTGRITALAFIALGLVIWLFTRNSRPILPRAKDTVD